MEYPEPPRKGLQAVSNHAPGELPRIGSSRVDLEFGRDARRALAAINQGGEPPSRLSRFMGTVLLLVVAALAISGGIRGIVWMWS